MRQRGIEIAVAAIAIASFGGCTTMSDDRLEAKTAAVLGVDPEEVRISNRDGSVGSSTYIATVNGRRYACVVGGGGVLALGMSTPPSCELALRQD